jgi:hypothetical protein
MCVMTYRTFRPVACGLLAPLALAVLSGCYSYNPYGYGGYPEVLSTVPTPTIAPSVGPIPGQPLPPGVVPIGPQAATPNGVVGSGLMPPTLATPTPATLPTTTQPVPNYQDPTDSAAGAVGQEPGNAGDGAAKSSTLRIPADGTLTSGVTESAGDVIQAGAATKAKPPAEFTAPATAVPIDAAPTSVPAINESNYGYDTAGYTWFKGTVEYDRADGAWHLMYSVTPSQNDPYGGDISLADDPRLEALQHNDVIYVTGSLKSGLTDRVGKPRFQIQQLSNITSGK